MKELTITTSRPVRGAWIEIVKHIVLVGLIHVAPRKGRVD